MRRLRSLALAVLALLAVSVGAACARGVTLNPNAGETYAVAVSNEMPHPMIIAFDDGSTRRILGTVGANREERFVVAAARPTVTLVATDEADTHTVRRTVTLVPGSTVPVRIN